MELNANELVVIFIVAVFFWRLKQALADIERRASSQLQQLTNLRDDSIGRVHGTDGETFTRDDGTSNSGSDCPLKDIGRADPSFNAKWFLENAAIVYEAVITAFAQGNRELLRPLLTADVYETFAREIDSREARGEHLEITFIRQKRCGILRSRIVNGRMEIEVLFNTELVVATRDFTGNVVAGDPAQIIKSDDLWTFTKIEPRSTFWTLAATESPAGDTCDISLILSLDQLMNNARLNDR
jgi:predicted lipid-binding transport protein (Tim44 family)